MSEDFLSTNRHTRVIGSFKQKLQLLQNAVFCAEEHFDILKGLEESRDKHNDLYQNYYDFLEPSRKAHFVSMLMSLCLVFDKYGLGRYYLDKKEKRYRYGYFIEKIEKYSFINKEKIEEIKTTLKQESSLINKVKILRDKHFAHAELNIEDALKRSELNKEDCACLISIAGHSVNEISCACGNGSFGSAPNGAYTLSRLLNASK